MAVPVAARTRSLRRRYAFSFILMLGAEVIAIASADTLRAGTGPLTLDDSVSRFSSGRGIPSGEQQQIETAGDQPEATRRPSNRNMNINGDTSMRTIVNRATIPPSSTPGRWGLVVVIALLAVWTLGMMGVIHLPLALVWILPFTAIVIGAFAVLWDGGVFDDG